MLNIACQNNVNAISVFLQQSIALFKTQPLQEFRENACKIYFLLFKFS